MACGLFGTACAYIGARALPDLLLNDEYMRNLDSLAVKIPPYTNLLPNELCMGAALKLTSRLTSLYMYLLRTWAACIVQDSVAGVCCASA